MAASPDLPDKAVEAIDFRSLRTDWYAGSECMPKLLRRACEQSSNRRPVRLINFPRHWLPVFEWFGARWRGSCEPALHVPFISGNSEARLLKEIAAAKRAGQLRLLAELMASADPLIAEVLPRLDSRISAASEDEQPARIRLSNWHSYGRASIRRYEEDLNTFRPSKSAAIFLPCGRTRPYDQSPTHRKLYRTLEEAGVALREHDLIVVTSLGPVPKSLWTHPTVIRYDTGVRDLYRMVTLFRRMLRGHRYELAWDCLRLRPYNDLLSLLAREGLIGELRRPDLGRAKSLVTYRPSSPAPHPAWSR
jgi:hypothetical protein